MSKSGLCWSPALSIIRKTSDRAEYTIIVFNSSKACNDKLVALPYLSYRCIVTVNVLWVFLIVLWVGLQCVIVVFSDHTHLLFVCLMRKPLYTLFSPISTLCVLLFQNYISLR